MRRIALASAAALALLSACAQIPTGPSVAVMPPPGKPFEVFQADDQACRSYASQSAGANANDASAVSLAESAVVGTALGAAVGAVAGGHAAGGAAVGAVAGTALGVHEADRTGRTIQQRYDIAYQQCMYARGDVLPGQTVSRYVPPPPPPQ
jgi:uncharacterized protein YcfJ